MRALLLNSHEKDEKDVAYRPDRTTGPLGSELFHFRISVIPGVVLCDLMEEVQIYIDEAPLTFPAAYLISCMTAIALGGFILLGFLLRNTKRPTASSVKACLTRSKVAPEMEED